MRPFLLSSYDCGHASKGQAARSYFQLYSLNKYRDITFLRVSFSQLQSCLYNMSKISAGNLTGTEAGGKALLGGE